MIEFNITDAPQSAEIAQLTRGLDQHSNQFAPPRESHPIAIFARDGNRLIGGLHGATYWDWLYIKLLWVDDAYRGQEVGRELVLSAENEARQRNCHSAHVNTHTFQASDFYLKLGYAIFGKLDDYPKGHKRIYLQKKLT